MTKYLERLSVKVEKSLKEKIQERFKKKSTGKISFKVNDKVKLTLEYMYGGKYCLKRVRKGHEDLLGLLLDIDKALELMAKEKRKRKT